MAKSCSTKKPCYSEFNMVYLSLDTVNITGRVVNEWGDALSNVNVFVQNNTTIGGATNSNGDFLIENVKNGSVVVVSHLGYRSVIFEVDKHSSLHFDIVLEMQNEELDEVLIVSKKPNKKVWWAIALAAIGLYVYASDEEKPKPKGLSSPKTPGKKPIEVNIS